MRPRGGASDSEDLQVEVVQIAPEDEAAALDSGSLQVEAVQAAPEDSVENTIFRRTLPAPDISQIMHQAGNRGSQDREEAAVVICRMTPTEDHDEVDESMSSSYTRCTFSDLDTCNAEDEYMGHDDELAMMTPFGSLAHVYPVDPERVAQAQPGEVLLGRDPRAKRPANSACPGCRHFRA